MPIKFGDPIRFGNAEAVFTEGRKGSSAIKSHVGRYHLYFVDSVSEDARLQYYGNTLGERILWA